MDGRVDEVYYYDILVDWWSVVRVDVGGPTIVLVSLWLISFHAILTVGYFRV